jgi:NADH:ubiquinone oxidoreductase subunit K
MSVARPSPRRHSGEVGRLYLLLTVGLLGWIVVLALRLPSHHVAPHYGLAWIGFDVGLAGVMLATGVLAMRRSPRLVLTAAATAAMLVTDAWFDVTTSVGSGLVVSLVRAAAVELPLAGLSLRVATHALTCPAG